MDLEMLQTRAGIIRQTRSFFDSKNYLELDTPLLAPDLIPESCLEVFETTRISPNGTKSSLYLIPSPEIWMKQIIAQHKKNVYQICKCFRNGESSGFLHSCEFTMLEYYTMNADYMDSLAITEEFFSHLAREAGIPSLMPPFERITVAEAFERYAGFDLFQAASKKGGMAEQAQRLGIASGAETGVLYDLIFIHAVEPRIKAKKPIVLLDYPAFIPCLAKSSGDTVERWELYYNGIELANCYSEETNCEKVKEFFTNELNTKNKTALVLHDVNLNYWQIFKDFPPCSGIALGLDRLIMAITGKSTIDGVLPLALM